MAQETQNPITHSADGEFNPPINEHRRALKEMEVSLPTPEVAYHLESIPSELIPGVKVHDDSIRLGIYRPKGLAPPYPTIFYIPGTAFTGFPRQFFDMVCGNLAKSANCQVVRLEHSLAPEYRYPSALEDIASILKHFVTTSDDPLKLDKEHLVLAGYSSGANLAALLIIFMNKSEDLKLQFEKLILVSPLGDFSRSNKAFKNNEKRDVTIPEYFIKWVIKTYLPIEANDTMIKAASLTCRTDAELRSFPTIFMFVGENDCVRGDIELLYERWATLGVKIFKVVVKDANHSLMWQNQEVIDLVGLLARPGFQISLPGVQSSQTNNRHALFTQGRPVYCHGKDDSDTQQNSPALLQSKL